MGFLDRLKSVFSGGGSPGASSTTYTYYVQCLRCGEPLKGRIDLRNDLSQSDDGESWIVRKGLVGSGERRCFQTIEVTLTFDRQKQQVLEQEIAGGKFITEEEYEQLREDLAAEPPEETA